jgi:hypothetical protein
MKTCYNIQVLLSYLQRIEKRRAKDECWNKQSFEQCRELSAWISLYRFGGNEIQKRAAAIINSWVKNS